VHAHVLLMEALGTTDPDFLDGILLQLLNAGSRAGKVDERGLNFLLSVVKGVKPRDQVEALLAAQMAAVHAATMTCWTRNLARCGSHISSAAELQSRHGAISVGRYKRCEQ
jgi:hypothetical protein